MKSTSIVAILLAGALSALAQGVMTFNNRIVGQVSAPFYGPETGDPTVYKTGNTAAGYPPGTQDYTGALLAGANWRAQLLVAPGVQSDPISLVPVGPSTTFQTGSAAGFVVPVAVAVPMPAETLVATFQVAIWDNSSQSYGSWAQAQQAWQSGLIAAGLSPLYYASPAGSTTFLRSFNATICPIPEPSTAALIGLGGLWLAIRQRRSSKAF